MVPVYRNFAVTFNNFIYLCVTDTFRPMPKADEAITLSTYFLNTVRMAWIREHRNIILIGLLFGVLYSLISLVNHYCFRTYALDLGLYTNAAYKYAHLQLADSVMIKEFYEPILGGHFDLYLALFSPLTYIFGTYSLLIVQIIALVFGGFGVYRYFQLSEHGRIPLYAAIHFYLFFGIYSALSTDYHSVVVASSLIPWFIISIHQNRKWLSALLLFLLLISQENVALWMVFLCIGLAIKYRNCKEKVTLLSAFSAVSLLYFLSVVHFIIPAFSAHQQYGGFQYSYLGNDMASALKTLLTHPFDSLQILFTNHTDSMYGDLIKAETHMIIVASGLFLLIKKPYYLIMLIPIYFQKFFHDNNFMWGVGGQYNIEFAPILAIGVFSVISEIKGSRLQTATTVTVLALTAAATLRTMDSTVLYTNKAQVRFYQKRHYERPYDVNRVHQHLSNIPEDAKVSSQSPFVPHLALRDNIYQFPIIEDAEYIVYSQKESPYPLTKEAFEIRTRELENSNDWEIYTTDELTILKKRAANDN